MLCLLFLVSQAVFPTELCILLLTVSQHSCILKSEERQKTGNLKAQSLWWTFKSITLCNTLSKTC